MTPVSRIGTRYNVTPPTAPTLRRYGLALTDWEAIIERQDGRCPVCERAFSSVIMNIDHEHVPGWKKLLPKERQRFVRGVLCARCNWKVVPDPTPPSANIARMAAYLEAYETRRKSRATAPKVQ